MPILTRPGLCLDGDKGKEAEREKDQFHPERESNKMKEISNCGYIDKMRQKYFFLV